MTSAARLSPVTAEDVSTPGSFLRAYRLLHGLTLSDVSEKTGLQVSTLSKLENGKTSFSYDKMIKVSAGLKIDVGQLLSPDSLAPPHRPSGRRSIGRQGDGVRIDTGGSQYRHLATDILDKAFLPMVGEVRARSLEEMGELVQHCGEEFIYVLSGTIELHTSLYAPVRLKAGESIYFDSEMKHAYLGIGDEPCVMLSICSAPKEEGDAEGHSS